MFKPLIERLSEGKPAGVGSIMPLTIPETLLNRVVEPVPAFPEIPINDMPPTPALPGTTDDAPQTARDHAARVVSILVELSGLIPETDRPRLQPYIDQASKLFVELDQSKIESILFDEWKTAAEREHEEVMAAGKAQAQAAQRAGQKAHAAEIALMNVGEEVRAARAALTAFKTTNTLGRWHTKSDIAKRDAEIERLRQRYAKAQQQKNQCIADANAANEELAEEKRKLQVLDVRERRLKAQLDGHATFDAGLGLASHSAPMPDQITLREKL